MKSDQETYEEYIQRQLHKYKNEVITLSSDKERLMWLLHQEENKNINLRVTESTNNQLIFALKTQLLKNEKKTRALNTSENFLIWLGWGLLVTLTYLSFHYVKLNDQNFKQQEIINNYQAQEAAKNQKP